MPREKESYRDNLERLMDRFPGKEILSLTEVSQYTGMGYRQLKMLLIFLWQTRRNDLSKSRTIPTAERMGRHIAKRTTLTIM